MYFDTDIIDSYLPITEEFPGLCMMSYAIMLMTVSSLPQYL